MTVIINTEDDDARALAAIKSGDRSYGAVAMTTDMGVTRAFQAVERLKAAGRIVQAKNGTVTEAKDG